MILDILVSLGLGSPIARFMALSAGGFAYQALMKPSISYVQTSAGYATRPFAFYDKSQHATYLPWWGWPVAGGLIGFLLL